MGTERMRERRYNPSGVNILLLQLKRIGDLILTIPAMVALRQDFPDARITLIVSNECADLLPAISSADRILVAQRNLSDIAIVVALARERFDYCIDFTRNDRSAFLAFLSRARKRIVSHRVRDQSKIRARIYNHFVDSRMRDMHTVDYNLALLEPLCGSDASRVVHLELPEVALEKANKLRSDSKIGAPFIIFHPGSARIDQFWDSARRSECTHYAGQNHVVDLVLTSGPSRLEQAHIIEIKTKMRPRIVDLSGRTDLLTPAA